MRRYVLAPLFVIVLLFAGCTLLEGNGEGCPETEFQVCGADGVTYTNPCFAHEAGVSVAHDGPCSSPYGNCTDEDGGKDIFVASNLISGGTYETDYCLDTATVVEHFCSQASAASKENIPCPPGYSCDEGACKASVCTDSDGGLIPQTKGTATSGSTSGTDSCIDSSTLTEFICKNGQVDSEEVGCPADKQCLDGACTEFQCTDSDGGQEKDEAGTVEKGDVSHADSCYDINTVKEYYCEAGDITSKNIDCASGDICSQGACVGEPTCEDTDGGKDRYTLGTTSYLEDSYTDACYSQTTVLEYFCEDNEIENVKLICGEGYKCSSGICTEVDCEADAEEFEEENERHEIIEVDEAEELRLYDDENVELDNDAIIQLVSFSNGDEEAFFLFFDDYEAFLADENEGDSCEDAISEGGSVDCAGVNLTVMLITDDYVDVLLDKDYFVVQYTDSEGFDVEWSGSDCDDDKRAYVSQRSYFYPYLDTDNDGFDLEGEIFIFFGMEAELKDVDVDNEEIEFEIDGEDYTLEDGEEFDYEDNTYDVELDFNDIGLVELDIDLS